MDIAIVYLLAPDIVLYCYPAQDPWLEVASLDATVSPGIFTRDLAASENSGQVFMASRFVFSRDNDFADARVFAATIGTDVYARTGGWTRRSRHRRATPSRDAPERSGST
jgi:hypothetical protein